MLRMIMMQILVMELDFEPLAPHPPRARIRSHDVGDMLFHSFVILVRWFPFLGSGWRNARSDVVKSICVAVSVFVCVMCRMCVCVCVYVCVCVQPPQKRLNFEFVLDVWRDGKCQHNIQTPAGHGLSDPTPSLVPARAT